MLRRQGTRGDDLSCTLGAGGVTVGGLAGVPDSRVLIAQ
jgi:hypothetical protein